MTATTVGSLILRGCRYGVAWVFLMLAGALVQPILSGALGDIPGLREAASPPARRVAIARKPEADSAMSEPLGCPRQQGAPQAADSGAQEVSAAAQGRQVTRVNLGAQSARIEIELEVPRCGAAVARLTQLLEPAVRDWSNEGFSFLDSGTGAVRFGNVSPRMSPPQIHVDEHVFRLTTVGELNDLRGFAADDSSLSLNVRFRGDSLFVGSMDLIVRTAPGFRLWSGSLLPTSQSAEQIQFLHLPNPTEATLTAFLPAENETSAVRATKPVSSALARAVIGGGAGVYSLWLGLSYALPFLALLWWAVRTQQATALKTYCALALTLIFGLTVAGFIDRIVPEAAWIRHESSVSNLNWVTYLGSTAFVCFIWPATVAAGSTTKGDSGAWALRTAVSALVITLYCITQWHLHVIDRIDLFALGDSLVAALGGGPSAPAAEDLASLLLIFVTFLSACLWVGLELAQGRGALRVALAAALGLGTVFVINESVFKHYSSIWGVVLAGLYGWTYSRVTANWLTTLKPDLSTGLAWARWVLIGLVIVLAVPPPGPALDPNSWILVSAAWTSIRLWQWLVLATLLLWFKERSSGADVRPLAGPLKAAAAAFMVVMFYWRAQAPLVPLLAGFAVGLFLQARWLFSSRPGRTFRGPRSAVLGRAIGEIALANDLARAGQGLRKALINDISSAKATAQDYLEKTRALEQTVRTRHFAFLRARCRILLALNQGSPQGAWERGKRGAVLALILSGPWLVSYFWSVSRGGLPDTNAYAVSEFTSIVLEVGRWPALGFFFLYFYPHIRGYNGIQKGLTLTLTLVGPALAATVIWSSRAPQAWLALLFWSLQAFICCMTVGVLLGDLGALRRAGRGPKSLFEVYNFGILAAWSSSLAIAVGAAATTALTTGVGSLFVAGIKLLLPAAPMPGK